MNNTNCFPKTIGFINIAKNNILLYLKKNKITFLPAEEVDLNNLNNYRETWILLENMEVHRYYLYNSCNLLLEVKHNWEIPMNLRANCTYVHNIYSSIIIDKKRPLINYFYFNEISY